MERLVETAREKMETSNNFGNIKFFKRIIKTPAMFKNYNLY